MNFKDKSDLLVSDVQLQKRSGDGILLWQNLQPCITPQSTNTLVLAFVVTECLMDPPHAVSFPQPPRYFHIPVECRNYNEWMFLILTPGNRVGLFLCLIS